MKYLAYATPSLAIGGFVLLVFLTVFMRVNYYFVAYCVLVSFGYLIQTYTGIHSSGEIEYGFPAMGMAIWILIGLLSLVQVIDGGDY